MGAYGVCDNCRELKAVSTHGEKDPVTKELKLFNLCENCHSKIHPEAFRDDKDYQLDYSSPFRNI